MSTVIDRVRTLIERSGGSQSEFAESIGLDKSKLSKSLSGVRRFSSLDLARIAEHSSVSVDWLLTGAESEIALAARTAAGTPTQQAIDQATRLADARADLAGLGYAQPWRPLLPAPPLGGRWVDQGAELARLASERMASARMASAGTEAASEDLALAMESAFGVDVCVADLGAQFDGLSVQSTDAVLILVAEGVLPWRQRFTMAHELGHLLAGDDQGLHVDEDVLDAEHRRQPSEVRANAFAAALLMPEHALREALGSDGLSRESFAYLACRLRVSPSALAYRLQTLRLIDAGTCEDFRGLSAQSAARLAGLAAQFAAEVASASRSRPPGLLTRDAFDAYLRGRATLRPYANLVGVDANALRADLEETDRGGLDPS